MSSWLNTGTSREAGAVHMVSLARFVTHSLDSKTGDRVATGIHPDQRGISLSLRRRSRRILDGEWLAMLHSLTARPHPYIRLTRPVSG
jgi:hypothetical protein